MISVSERTGRHGGNFPAPDQPWRQRGLALVTAMAPVSCNHVQGVDVLFTRLPRVGPSRHGGGRNIEHRTLNFEHRTLDLGPWTLDLGPWTLDLGPWTLDLGPWTLDSGLTSP